MSFHADTEVLVWACTRPGSARERLWSILESGAPLGMSAWAWYEFRRGPRTAEQLAAADILLGEGGVIPVSAEIAGQAAEVFRRLGSPRKRAADVLIGVTAVFVGAKLVTCNARDFAGIPGLSLEVVEI